MDEQAENSFQAGLEARARALFEDSVAGVDMPTRSRLTQARHAALEAARATRSRPWFLRGGLWAPATGVSAAALLGATLWLGGVPGLHSSSSGLPSADGQANLEDLEIVAASDEGTGEPLEMLQDDLEFYDFVDKAASNGPEA